MKQTNTTSNSVASELDTVEMLMATDDGMRLKPLCGNMVVKWW